MKVEFRALALVALMTPPAFAQIGGIAPNSYRGSVTIDRFTWPVVLHINQVVGGVPSGEIESWPSDQSDDRTTYGKRPFTMAQAQPGLELRFNNGNYYYNIQPNGQGISAIFHSQLMGGKEVSVTFIPLR